MNDIEQDLKNILLENVKLKDEVERLKHNQELQQGKRLGTPEGPYFTRHNQWAWVTDKDDVNAWGYILGDSGKLHRWSWYCSSNDNNPMPYVAEADYPSGRDLFKERSYR